MTVPEPDKDYKVYYDQYRNGHPETTFVWGPIVHGDLDGGPVTVHQRMSGRNVTIVHPIKFEQENYHGEIRDPTDGRSALKTMEGKEGGGGSWSPTP